MKKLIFLFVCTVSIMGAVNVTIKNDTAIDYFIICDEIGYLMVPKKELQLEVPEVNWLKSWWHDPSVITLFKKVGDQEEFTKVFYVTPRNTDDKDIIIFISDVQRKARHVSAPFSVKAVNHETDEEK